LLGSAGCSNISRIKDFYTVQSLMYFRTAPHDSPSTEHELWTSDGTVAGTTLIHHSIGIGGVFEIVGKTYFLSHINENETAIIRIRHDADSFHLITKNMYSSIPIDKIIRTSKGLFFCGALEEPVNPYQSNTSLLRIANNFELEPIEQNCDFAGALFSKNDLIYYEGDSALWVSSGIRGDQKPILVLDDNNYFNDFCFSQSNLFFSTRDSTSRGHIRSYKYSKTKGSTPLFTLGTKILECVGKNLFLATVDIDEDYHATVSDSIYSIDSGKKIKLTKEADTFLFSAHGDTVPNNNTILEYEDRFFALLGRTIEGAFLPNVDLVKIYKSDLSPFLPSLNLLLDKK